MPKGAFRKPIVLATRIAGLCLAITAAWFVGFLIPQSSRDLLIGRQSDGATRGAFVVVVTVASLAAWHSFRVRNSWTAVAAWGISAPVGGFLVFLFGPGLVSGDIGRDSFDARTLGVLAEVVRYYLIQCWYVILTLGPATALVLSWHAARSQPGRTLGGREQEADDGIDVRSSDLRYPM